jgi:hypothetical protein
MRSIAILDKVATYTLLKAHFGGFEWDKALTGKLEQVPAAYVHLRMDEEVLRDGTCREKTADRNADAGTRALLTQSPTLSFAYQIQQTRSG